MGNINSRLDEAFVEVRRLRSMCDVLFLLTSEDAHDGALLDGSLPSYLGAMLEHCKTLEGQLAALQEQRG